MAKILSTKKLEYSIHQQAKSNGFQIDEVEVIETKPIPVDDTIIESIQQCECLIFTSYAAWEALNLIAPKIAFHGKAIFCVGDRIAAAFSKLDCLVFQAKNAEELSQKIIAFHPPKMIYLKGNMSLPTLEDNLAENKVEFESHVIYNTELLYPAVAEIERYDFIWFFSPSGVESLLKRNSITSNTKCIAIGNTTKNSHPGLKMEMGNATNPQSMLLKTINIEKNANVQE